MIGYCLSCEQFTPAELLEQAQMAEQAGFQHLLVSDHLQPWVPQQGQSSFVWTILGALGQVCGLPLATGVTVPGYRYHPAVLAQAAATVAALYPQRFTLGLGTGEALNEHVTATYWPEPHERVQRLLEAAEIIERLLRGEEFHHQGPHFRMEKIRLYTLPSTPPPLLIASSGPYLSQQAGRRGYGFLTPKASADKLGQLLQRYQQGWQEHTSKADGADTITAADEGNAPRRWVQLHVSWDTSEEKALDNALREWPNGAMNFPKADIRYPQTLAEIAKTIVPQQFEGRVLIATEAQVFRQAIAELRALGFNGIFLHNVGRNQREFMRFAREIL